MRPLLALLVTVFFALLCAPPASAVEFTLTAPVNSRVLKGFDDVGPYAAGHRGVDLAGTAGQPVIAAAEGRVHFSGSVAGTPTVSIDHGNGWRTTYQPVHSTLTKDAVVQQGQQIGTLLTGHCPVTACLHWGLTDGDSYADPTSYLTIPIIRLLPRGALPPSPPSISPPQATHEMAAPVQGRLTSAFGMRRHPVTGIYKLHDGTDYAAPCGTPITLPAAGEVTSAGYHGGYGYRVIVSHGDGLVTAYAHLPSVSVSPGQRLAAGSVVGVVGNTGLSTGCHLHWMAWRSGSLIDPQTLLP